MQANPQFSPPCVTRIVALVKLGRNEEAQAGVPRLLELWPALTIAEYTGSNFTSPERLAMYAEGLRRAGLPE
jgi:hypothetical protein